MSTIETLGMGTWMAMPELPIQLRDDLTHSFGSTSRSRSDVLSCSSAITPQFAKGPIHSLLGGSDGMDWGQKSLHHANVDMDDVGWGDKQVVVQEA